MIWSISTYKEFQWCQRKWFLNKKVASRSPKDSYRRKVYLLSKLENIAAWRGKIVDYTISECVIPKLNNGSEIKSSEVYDFAKKVSRARYEFAKKNKFKERDLKKSDHEYDYSAIYDFEYTNSTDDLTNKFTNAWNEIYIALTNFLNNATLINKLNSANYLIKQRNLTFTFHDTTIKAVPDLIAFYENGPPHIFDWKVHYFGTKTYSEQLMLYAIALKSCNPHRDFQTDLTSYSIQDISLTEYQLLKNLIRNYNITEYHIEAINDFLANGLQMMKRKGFDEKYENLNIEDFEKTQNLDACITCQFKKICRENEL